MPEENSKAAAGIGPAAAPNGVDRLEQQGQHSTGAAPSKIKEQAEQISRLFAGNQSCHGTHGDPDFDEEKSKWAIKKTARTISGPPTVELWEAHLAGVTPLGVVPIREDS